MKIIKRTFQISRTLLGMLLTIISCAGDPVDSKISKSYYIKDGAVCFVPMGNAFELGSTKTNADPDTFQVLSEDIGKDRRYVYYKSVPQTWVDRNTFYIQNGIPKDKNHVYLPNNTSLGTSSTDSLVIIPYADPKTFTSLKSPYDDFQKDKNRYFYEHKPIVVDYSSFHILNRAFAKDEKEIYSYGLHRFTPLGIKFQKVKSINEFYVQVDDNTILFFKVNQNIGLLSHHFDKINTIKSFAPTIIRVNDKILMDGNFFKASNVDAETFELIEKKDSYNLFSKDKNHVYFAEKEIKGADPHSYEILEDFFAKDKNHIYRGENEIKGADLHTFQILNFSFSKDKNHVYYESSVLQGADPKTFKEVKDYALPYTFGDQKGNHYNENGERVK